MIEFINIINYQIIILVMYYYYKLSMEMFTNTKILQPSNQGLVYSQLLWGIIIIPHTQHSLQSITNHLQMDNFLINGCCSEWLFCVLYVHKILLKVQFIIVSSNKDLQFFGLQVSTVFIKCIFGVNQVLDENTASSEDEHLQKSLCIDFMLLSVCACL